MASHLPPPAVSDATPALQATTAANDHTKALRRIFIGPMPEAVAVAPDNVPKRHFWSRKGGSTPPEDAEETELSRIPGEHALLFFLRHGGREEDWGEEQESSIRREMLKRWKESGWSTVFRKRRMKLAGAADNWVGKTFVVGDFLGIQMLDKEPPVQAGQADNVSLGRPRTSGTVTRSTTSSGSFVTAASVPPLQPARDSDGDDSSTGQMPFTASTSAIPLVRTSSPLRQPVRNGRENDTARSEAALLSRPPMPPPTRSALKKGDNEDRKPKTVQFPAFGDESPSATVALAPRSAAEPPAAPTDVLARDPGAEELAATSAGAVASTQVGADGGGVSVDDVVLRDRMLVRVSHTKMEGLGSLDETQARIQQDLQQEEWAEFNVVWRKHQIELYEEYSLPGKEWLLGHKHLAFIVPLKEADTHLSLFSPTDMSFCLACKPKPVKSLSKRRAMFYSRGFGTNIFVFKCKSRSRAADWIWRLWRKLGGVLPKFVDIYAPAAGTRVRLELSDDDEDAELYSLENIIAMCRTSMSGVPDWSYLVETAIQNGTRLALAWRQELKLDWVWLPMDVDGDPRTWSVLYGLAVKHLSIPSSLEIRLAQHFPTRLVLPDGSLLSEPPAVEGYLRHVRGSSSSRVYLSTHDCNIYILPVVKAHPPAPPAPPVIVDGVPHSSITQETEVQRGAQQLLDAEGLIDMRNIVDVRPALAAQVQALHAAVAATQAETVPAHSDTANEGGAATAAPQAEVGDDEDGDGSEQPADKPQEVLKRSFELCMSSGHVERFEAHSRTNAREWITHLTQLVAYWTHRHRVDARTEMELNYSATGAPRFLLGTSAAREKLERAPDAEEASPLLSTFWHWCVLDSCRSVVKGGRLYVKNGVKGRYLYRQVVLTAGHVMFFSVSPRDTARYPRVGVTSLQDAYVCSGILATLLLPRREYLVAVAPKRYPDGLESDDSEEDTTFIIWYRQTPVGLRGNATRSPVTAVPPLDSNRKLFVMKARTKLERDQWCWALNCEIERIVRQDAEREKRRHEAGGLVQWKR